MTERKGALRVGVVRKTSQLSRMEAESCGVVASDGGDGPLLGRDGHFSSCFRRAED